MHTPQMPQPCPSKFFQLTRKTPGTGSSAPTPAVGALSVCSRRGFLGLAAAAATASAAALSACAAPAAPTEDGLTPITFVLDYTPNTNHSGLYIAQKKGYFQDLGLDVTIVQPPEDGADALVASGRAQLGMSYQDGMANYVGSENPLPVTAIAAVIQHNTSGIMSRAGEGVTTPAGLQGKRYGSLDWDIETNIIKTLVKQDGGSFDQVEMLPANSTDEISGLKTGQFDAIMVFEGWAGQRAALLDYPVDYFSFISEDPRFDFYTPVIIANNTFLAEQPDVAARFLAACAMGYGDAAQNPKEAAEILVEAAPEVDPDLALASAEYLAARYQDDAPYWGLIDTERWDTFYQWINSNHLTDVPIDSGAAVDMQYLTAAQEYLKEPPA